MEKEESAIDKIYKIEQEITAIKQYQQLLDNNMKLVLNKLNKITKLLESPPVEKKIIPQIIVTPGTLPALKSTEENIDNMAIGNIKTFGHIVNKSKEPIKNVEVNIYNDKNEIVKKRKTDDKGYWEVRLHPGKYGVEYIQSGFHPVNRTISLEKAIKSYEVK